jgi:magnesium transporter
MSDGQENVRRAKPGRRIFRQMRVVGRLVRRTNKEPGTAPGTVVHSGPRRVEKVDLHLMRYDLEHIAERELASVAEAFPLEAPPSVTWLNIDGLHDTTILTEIGQQCRLHPLVLEDIVNIGQRPKLEEYDEYLFAVLRMLSYDEEHNEVGEEQVSLVIGQDYVLSFQEAPGDVFDPVRERARGGKGQMRKRGSDYLAYALIDAIVDEYFAVLEKLGDHIEKLENDVLHAPTNATIHEVHRLKREILVMRRAIWPVRDLISSLLRAESSCITDNTKIFLRDAYDHVVQLIDTVETLRDLVSGMIDLYLSNVSNRMNEVMKVLTTVATLFIPLTFIAGIYGMNFDHMPELHWRWAYPMLWAVMLVVAGGMVLYFKRKRWF